MSPAISQPEEAVVKVDDYIGALTNIEDKIQTAGLSTDYDTDDSISLSDDHENHTKGALDPGTFDNDAVYTRAFAILCIHAWRAPNRKQFTYVFMPEGAGTGLEAHTFETFMTGFEINCDDKSTASMSRKNKISGAIAKSVQP